MLDFDLWSDPWEEGCVADLLGLEGSFWLVVGWEADGLLDFLSLDCFNVDVDWVGPRVETGPLLKLMTGIGSATSIFGAWLSSCEC